VSAKPTHVRFTFNERKAIQAAGRLIQLAGGEMNYLALMKLLYLVDREALFHLGRPITGDKVVAMKHGPVLSRIFDLVSKKKGACRPATGTSSSPARVPTFTR
jgi:uncharacterized phage-associated protein